MLLSILYYDQSNYLSTAYSIREEKKHDNGTIVVEENHSPHQSIIIVYH